MITVAEFMQLPEKRTMPFSAAERKSMEELDASPEMQTLPDFAGSLIIKYVMVYNYLFCEQTFKRALVDLRPLFNEQPQVPVEAPAPYDASKSEYLKQQGLVPVSVKQAETRQAKQEAKSFMEEAAKELEKQQRESKFRFALNDVEKLDGSSLVGKSDRDRESRMVPGRSQGMVSHADKFRQRIEAYEKLKETFNEPAEIAEIDKRIAKEREHLRW